MQTAVENDFVSVADYLAAEQTSEVRHEYLGGWVYAMAGETRAHNTIALNLATAIRQHLKGGSCKVYMSDIRVNLQFRGDEYYYYPDIVVTCDARDTDAHFVRFPKLIMEVKSKSTERIDKREKFFAYTSISSLEEYVLVSQTRCEATVFRPGEGWKAEHFSEANNEIMLRSLDQLLPFSLIYEGV